MPQNRPGPPTGQSTAQEPALDTFASVLEQAAAETLEQCRADSAAILKGLASAIDTLRDNLTKSRSRLAASFTQIRDKNIENISEAAEQLQKELNTQCSRLLETARPQFEQQLKSLAPDRKPVLGLLEKMAESARQAVDALPDEQEPSEPAPEPIKKPLLQRLNKQFRDISGMGEPLHLTPKKRVGRVLPAIETLQQNPLVTAHADLFARLESKTDDFWSSLRFHFQVAGEELDVLKAEPTADMVPDFDAILSDAEQLSLGVLDSIAEQFATQTLALNDFWSDLCDRLQEHEAGFSQSLCEALAGLKSQETGAWPEFRRTLRHHRDSLHRQILSHKDPNAPMGLLSLSKAVKGSLRDLIQQEPKVQEKLLGLTDLPSTREILTRADAFPLLYRRLFTLGPLKNREFLVARDEERKTLDDLYQRWENSKACSLAIIGPEGSGKTSLANCFAGEYGARGNLLRFEISRRLRSEQNVVDLFHQWFSIEQPTDSLDALVQQLLARPRGMIIVEGGHNLSLRIVGGSRAAEVFFFLLLATRRHYLWLITFRRIPWTRMDYQFGISQFFTHQIPTLLVSQQEVLQALMLRQRISCYPLDFLGESVDKAEAPTPEEQDNREERFFRELFAAAGGNLDAALYYWLLCLDYDPELKRFQARPLGKIDFSFLRSLDRDQLFTLAEVLGHGVLATGEHSEIFHCDLLRSRLQLDFLGSLGLLLDDPPGDSESPNLYRLNPVYYAPVTNILESMHILY